MTNERDTSNRDLVPLQKGGLVRRSSPFVIRGLSDIVRFEKDRKDLSSAAVAWVEKGKILACGQAIYRDGNNIGVTLYHETGWVQKRLSPWDVRRQEEAIQCYDKALEIDPHCVGAWRAKGLSLGVLGRQEETIQCYDKALEIDPQDTVSLFYKGWFLAEFGRHDEAIQWYDKALEIDQQNDARREVDHTSLLLAKAWCLEALGRHDEMIHYYDKLLEMDPHDPVWYDKGISLEALGRSEESILCYNKVLEIKPTDYWSWHARASAAEKLGRTQDAAESYRRFIALAPPTECPEHIDEARACLRRLGARELGPNPHFG
ncbi:MAG: tetratricopeptide repeat protein [Chloroflexi bacterium]|nr:tetratricopeptide repeat protein [Chloroflexota bacterium]